MTFKYEIQHAITVKAFLQSQQFSKKTVSAIKRDGALLVNGKHVTVRHFMNKGDVLTVEMPNETASSYLIPYERPIHILYEDAHMLIVSKPKHQNSAPSRDHQHESLVEQVLAYSMQGQTCPAFVPHLVTRLDRQTSGAVLFAKSGHMHHLLSMCNIQKQYLCICYGIPAQAGEIVAPIARHPDSIIERHVDQTHGKFAHTVYTRERHKDNVAMCRVELLTGRTHQIRVHFQYMGHPLVGDDLYGGWHEAVDTQCLHCYQLHFHHPITSTWVHVVDDTHHFEKIWQRL